MLWKKGQGGVLHRANWKEREFVLTSSPKQLSYFDGSTRKGSLDFEGVAEAGGAVEVGLLKGDGAQKTGNSGSTEGRVAVPCGSRTLYMASQTEAEMHEWVDALCLVLQVRAGARSVLGSTTELEESARPSARELVTSESETAPAGEPPTEGEGMLQTTMVQPSQSQETALETTMARPTLAGTSEATPFMAGDGAGALSAPAIHTRGALSAELRPPAPVPEEELRIWMWKKGDLNASWKRRFCVLQSGLSSSPGHSRSRSSSLSSSGALGGSLDPLAAAAPRSQYVYYFASEKAAEKGKDGQLRTGNAKVHNPFMYTPAALLRGVGHRPLAVPHMFTHHPATV
jgi:hypothetical protein